MTMMMMMCSCVVDRSMIMMFVDGDLHDSDDDNDDRDDDNRDDDR